MNDVGSDALPLIRHGCAAPPSPRGRLLDETTIVYPPGQRAEARY